MRVSGHTIKNKKKDILLSEYSNIISYSSRSPKIAVRCSRMYGKRQKKNQ
jgi:hypothetical protein